MKRAVYICNILKHITSFHIPYIKLLNRNGYQVDVITNSEGMDKPECCHELFDIGIERSPFNAHNISALKQAKAIINEHDYDLIHVHTPMGGVIGRLAAKKVRKRGAKVIYTSHGFHFYDGAPLANWLLYYTMERLLVPYTDCIITINSEDYKRALKMASSKCQVAYMDGVGVDINRFHVVTPEQREMNKKRFGYDGKLIAFYAAEFIARKNHRFLIDNFAQVVSKVPDARLLLAGDGPLQEEMIELSKAKGLDDKVIFLGYRKDVPDLLGITDVNISTSNQEGFPINIVEGIASGCPELVSAIRGNIDAVSDDVTGLVYEVGNGQDFTNKLCSLLTDEKMRRNMNSACENEVQRFSLETLVPQMAHIYSDIMEDEIRV